MEIIIEDAVLRKQGRRVTNHLKIDKKIKKYFQTHEFYAEYDQDISDVPMGILNIPALSSVIHIAWAVGCDVDVGIIDEKYVKGLEKTRHYLKDHKGFEKLRFTTVLSPRKTETIQLEKTDKKGLLFSGGCDSTSSYIEFKDKKPELIIIWGLDMRLSWPSYWQKTISKYDWMKLNKIKTNSEEMYGYFTSGTFLALNNAIRETYMPGYSFSINRLGLCAPIATKKGVTDLMFSATYPSREYGDKEFTWSQNRPNTVIDSYFEWGATKCRDVQHEYTTNEKIRRFIKPYFEEYGPLFLRSCGHRTFLEVRYKLRRLNCLECDKCERVIGMLVVNDIDPNTCGFPIQAGTFNRIKNHIKDERWNKAYLYYHWREIQQCIPANITQDYNGSRDFLVWLREYDFEGC